MQNSISKNQNINFKADIRFVSRLEYRNIISKCPSAITIATEMDGIKDVKKVEDFGVTQQIIYCIAGIVKNLKQKKDCIFHMNPDFLQKIEKSFDDFTMPNNPQGVVIGGLSHTSKRRDEKLLSIKLLNFLKKKLTLQERRKFTLFFGQKQRYNEEKFPAANSSFIYVPKSDTYYINCREFNPSKMIYTDLDLTKESIRDNFDVINVSDNNKVYIGLGSKKIIPNSFWQKNFNLSA